MNRVVPLASSKAVRVFRFDHPHHAPHHDPAEETASIYSINFVEKGGFEITINKNSWQLSAGTVFVTRPGMVYRCRHYDAAPNDVCLSLAYTSSFSDNVKQTSVPTDFQPVFPKSNRMAYLHSRLAGTIHGPWGNMALETLAGELLASTLTPNATARRSFREQQLGWYARRVDYARTLLEEQYSAEHTLDSLATAVGMSPFHFARVFSELMGMPPHRFLLKVRLRNAAERLLQGDDVTHTCFAVGFNNLSHFIRSFRRNYGVSPSRYVHDRPTQ